ncbi:MAG: IS66 family transposase [Deltaproteobacteria bacterium]
MVDIDRTKDVELLRQVAKIQETENERLRARIVALSKQVDTLKGGGDEVLLEQIALLEKELQEARRGTSSNGSERRPKKKEKRKKPTKKSKSGRTAQPDLAVQPVHHHLEVEDFRCKACGGGLEEWKGHYEEADEIDIIDVQYVIKRHRRLKYRCRCGECIHTSPGPLKLVQRGRYGIDFMISIGVDRFQHQTPLNRQVERMKTFGLRVTTQTLWDQTREVADCFEDAVERLHQYLVAQDILLADESHWPLLGARGRPTKNWYTWALANDHAVLYKIMDSRSNAAAAELLRDFSGTLMTDGYVVYTSKSKSLGFKQAHCWSHGRRKFLEAEDSAPEIAGQFLDEIGQLFGIERMIAEQVRGLPADEANKRRAEIRDEQSRPIVEELGRQMAQVKALPKSPIAKAIRYYENRWAGMTRFLDDPRIAMTTNAAERALRATVLGRKNSLGSRSERGIEVAEVFYTLIGSCKLNGIDPRRYLREGIEHHLAGRTVPLPHEIG